MKQKKNSILIIRNLHARVGDTEILHGVNMTIRAGEVHAVMGPNGSGKSTLASVLLGHPAYVVNSKQLKVNSKIVLDGKNILPLSTQDRALSGLFLAFQSPIAIPGVTVMNLLRASYELRHQPKQLQSVSKVQNPVLARRFQVGSMSIGAFTDMVKNHAKTLRLDEELLRRGIHDGFSGGEKKKIEMLQALVLPHAFAVFDEIDTGLDVDALRAVSKGIGVLRAAGVGVLVITHYQRILKYVKPDVVHVLVAGKIVDSGNHVLAQKIESKGYAKYL